MGKHLPEEHEFALCLTHDVDRPYKTYQSIYYALKEKDTYHLESLLSSRNPYWQFENIMQIEKELGVRSTFYFLNEKNLFTEKPFKEWLKPQNWKRFTGRYNINSEELVDIITTLDDGGWEIGLHGSYESYDDKDRLSWEKSQLESILGHEIIGGRQHYLNLKQPETWEYHREMGLRYDSSLGSSTEYGFQEGYDIIRPFDDEFVVFPLTIMEVAIMEGRSFEEAWRECQRILREARDHNAIMTILWHPKVFSEEDYPGYKDLYVRLIQEAQDMGAWVGKCSEIYNKYISN